ncbi:FAM219B isoform 5 [Pongo abelii]|uniref:FAM219B isoform 5 n=1 Tax=Pongo abelii TaxID=9601 RepID=A0A2J8UDH0_PONAB|nr:FAM219B isoform 5 [Pongo abelii]
MFIFIYLYFLGLGEFLHPVFELKIRSKVLGLAPEACSFYYYQQRELQGAVRCLPICLLFKLLRSSNGLVRVGVQLCGLCPRLRLTDRKGRRDLSQLLDPCLRKSVHQCKGPPFTPAWTILLPDSSGHSMGLTGYSGLGFKQTSGCNTASFSPQPKQQK